MTLITAHNEDGFYDALRNTLAFRYDVMAGFRSVRHPKDVVRLLQGWAKCTYLRLGRARPLVKDPLAVFSAEWLAKQFGMEVVVMIRHPAAFVESVRRAGWSFPFASLASQPELLARYPEPFEAEIRKFAASTHDILEQAILLWKAIYYVVKNYQETHDGWLFVRHEDIARSPEAEFRSLYKRLDLEYTAAVRRKVARYSSSRNSNERIPGSIRRDSRAVIRAWKTGLSEREVHQVRRAVEDISSCFYSDDDW